MPASASPMVAAHYTASDGLPVASTYGSAIDDQGFLWLATHDGLARFDGQHFSIFDAARSPQMTDNRITNLYSDPQHRVYALTSAGQLLGVSADTLQPAVTDGGIPLPPVRFVQAEPLCATGASGLYCADGSGHFKQRLGFENGTTVAAALAAPAQRTWIIVPGSGILLQLPDKRRTILLDAELRTSPNNDVLALVDKAGDLWAVLNRRLLHARQDGSVNWLDAPDGQALNISQLRLDSDDSVWVGTEHGVFRTLGDHLVAVDLPRTTDDSHLMYSWRGPDGQLWSSDNGSLYKSGDKVLETTGVIEKLNFDHEGVAWVSTLRDGFYVLTEPRVEVIGKQEGLVEDNFYGIARSRDGTLWIGSLGGGVQALHPDGQVVHYGVENGLPGLNTWVVATAPNGDVYASPYIPGLYRKTTGSERFERLPLPQALATAKVLALDFDRQGRLWCGSSEGAWRLDPDGWHKIWPTLDTATVSSILQAADGSVWLGGNKGLWRLYGNDASEVAHEKVGRTVVRNIFQDRASAIWISTEGNGLIRITGDGSRDTDAIRLGRAQGLPSNSPHAVLQDATGNLWVNSNQGIFRMTGSDLADFLDGHRTTLTPLVLGKADGLKELEGNGGVQPASLIDEQGRLLFPTQHGLVRIDPRKLPLHTVAPRPVVDSLEGDNKFVPATGYDPLPQDLRSIQISYGAIDLHASYKVRFRYRLLPIQEHWTDAGNQRVALFVALAPGRYRFEVVAGNSDGFWSRQPATVQFYIPPRWYESGANRSLFLLALLWIVIWLVRRRTRILHAHAADLDAQVGARTAELAREKSKAESALADLAQTHRQLAAQTERLQAMDAFRTRLLADVSHELRTPLMLVNLTLKELQDDEGLQALQRRRVSQSLQQGERLNRLVEQLIGLAQAEAGQIRLRFSRLDLGGFVHVTVAALRPAAERAGVRLDVDCGAQDMLVFIDSDRLTTVLGNLIDNACRYAPPGSSVSISAALDEDGGCACVTVSDRGPGFPPEVAEHLFQRFFRVDDGPRAGREGLGIGLALARELVDLHGGRIGACATPGEGARFWFELPLGSAHIALEDLALENREHTAQADDAPITSTVATATASHGEGLLMVEDHPDLASYLGERLAELVQVKCVGTAREAWKQLELQRPALLIIDVVLPDGSGIALCRQICTDPRFADLPVILMSARATQEDQLQGMQAGATTFLTKPFSFDDLLAAIVRGWPTMGSLIERTRASADDTHVAPILELAQKSLQQAAFGIAEWADQAHLSERQLRRRVIDLTGMAPQAWLREQRLQLVHRLVQSDACRTLAEAGIRAGLENASYLYRLYRQRFGQMPRSSTMT